MLANDTVAINMDSQSFNPLVPGTRHNLAPSRALRSQKVTSMDEKISKGRRVLVSERVPGRTYDMYAGDAPTRLYADGFAGTYLGPAVSRIDFYRNEDMIGDGDPEARERFAMVNIPTAALVEFLFNTIKQIVDNKDPLITHMDMQQQGIRNMLAIFEDQK